MSIKRWCSSHLGAASPNVCKALHCNMLDVCVHIIEGRFKVGCSHSANFYRIAASAASGYLLHCWPLNVKVRALD